MRVVPAGRIVPARFYARETELVARDMLGMVLECHTPAGVASGVIVETEAYLGEHDAACHASAGRTRRTDPLYGAPGTAYVYLIYGMYWCVNAVTRESGLPSAVLVRALDPLRGVALMQRRRPAARSVHELANGPGKLCRALGIDGAMNGKSLQRRPILVRAGTPVSDQDVDVTPRIGITRAAEWPLRFVVRGHPAASRTPRAFSVRPYEPPRA